MTVTDTPTLPNGVNVEALLGAREQFKTNTELTKFQWRARNEWVNGTHSRTVIDDFSGAGGEQAHKAPVAHDADHPELQDFTPLQTLQPLVGSGPVDLPSTVGAGVVVQHAEGPIEDGHEVMFQTESPIRQYRCFLQSSLTEQALVADHGTLEDPCP